MARLAGVDPVGSVLGTVFVTAGIIVVTGGRLIDEGRFLAPLGLVGLGVALLLRASSAYRDEDASPGQVTGSSGE